MPKINVFKDKDGDFVVTNADTVAPGISAFQLRGAEFSTPAETVTTLQDVPGFVLAMNAGRLAGDAGDFIASLKHELAYTAEVEEDDKVYQILTAA